MNSKTACLIKSFRLWNAYDPRSLKDKADHLRWCRATSGPKRARQIQLQLLTCRIGIYQAFVGNK